MEWATLPPDRHASWALRLSDVCAEFARHISNLDPRTEVPPVGVLPGWKRAKPYVYSDAQIDALQTAALALPPEGGLRRWTYHTLFGLIAVTGMRLSEAMAIERDDVDLDVGVLTVRLTKFGQIAARAAASDDQRRAEQLRQQWRDAHLGPRCGSTFFVAEQGGRLLHQCRPSRLLAPVPRDRAAAAGDHGGPRATSGTASPSDAARLASPR